MSDDDLAADLRRHLEAMARRPAPDGLVRRVAAIPDEAVRGGRMRTGSRSLAVVRAAASLVLAVTATLLALTIWGRLPVQGPGGQGTSPSGPSPSPSASGQSSASPPPQPSGTSGPAGTFPSDVLPLAVHFVDPATGWALGASPCPGANTQATDRCPIILGTTSGGRSWGVIARPEINLSGVVGPGLEAPRSGVGRLAADSASDLWLWGSDLWASHDAGRTWSRIALPDGAGNSTLPVVDLAVGSERVYAAVLDDTAEPPAFRVFSSPLGADAWRPEPVSVPLGAGPVPEAQLVRAGSRLWLLAVNRVVVGGARLEGTSWTTWSPPCLDAAGPAAVAAADDRHLAALCDVGVWSTPVGLRLYRSDDGGVTTTPVGGRLPLDEASLRTLAYPDPDSLIVAASQGGRSVLAASFDAGGTWRAVWSWDAQPGAAGLSVEGIQFVDPSTGFALAHIVDDSAAAGLWPTTGILLATTDGGASWRPVAGGPDGGALGSR